MTTLGKTLFITLSLAALIAGTLVLRSEPEQAAHAQLTAAQRAEMQPAAKPPKTTEWTAPIRAQASIAITASGTIGM